MPNDDLFRRDRMRSPLPIFVRPIRCPFGHVDSSSVGKGAKRYLNRSRGTLAALSTIVPYTVRKGGVLGRANGLYDQLGPRTLPKKSRIQPPVAFSCLPILVFPSTSAFSNVAVEQIHYFSKRR